MTVPRRIPAAVAFIATFLLCTSLVHGKEDKAGEQLAALLDDIWEWNVSENPLFATSAGDHRFNDKLPKVSVADSKRRHEKDREFMSRLESLDRENLSPADQVNYDLIARQLREDIAEFGFESHLIPITHRSGFHVEFPELRREVPLVTMKDYENYIARLRAFDDYAAGHIELLRAGIAADKTLPDAILGGWEPTVETHIVDEPERSLLYEPFKDFPTTVPESEHERLQEEAREAIRDGVAAGYRRFRDFMRDEYVPRARGSISASALTTAGIFTVTAYGGSPRSI